MLCNDVFLHIPSQLFSDVTLEYDISHAGTTYAETGKGYKLEIIILLIY